MQKVLAVVAFCCACGCPALQAQELNARVAVNHQQIQGTSTAVFEKLQTALTSFLNDRQWTNLQYSNIEKIDCSFNLILSKYVESENRFEGSLQVTGSRPVFDATYTTVAFSTKDANVSFTFQEFDQLEFRNDQIDNNLTALFAFYAYLLIGIDMDTMAPKGGQAPLESAQAIANSAQNLQEKGWKAFEDNKNRFALINDYMDNAMEPFRQLQYRYHREGLDEMAQNAERGRATISQALELLRQARTNKSSSAWPQLFTEYKKDELISLYQGKGTSEEKSSVYGLLMSINPSQSSSWAKIRQ